MIEYAATGEVDWAQRWLIENDLQDLTPDEYEHWLTHSLSQGGAPAEVAVACAISGAIDPAALRRALATLIERHPALCLAYPERSGAPCRILGGQDDADGMLTVTEAAAESVAASVSALAVRSFDLSTGPLFRAGLVQVDDGDSVIVLTAHQAVCDDASMLALLKELGDLYAAVENRTAPAAAPVSRNGTPIYPASSALLRHWVDSLAGFDPENMALTLPDGVDAGPFDGAQCERRLPAAITSALTSVAARLETDERTLLLAAYFVLLHLHGAQDDMVVGHPLRSGDEPVVAPRTPTAAIRLRCQPSDIFAELVARTRAAVLTGQQHSPVPLGQIVTARVPTGADWRTPLFRHLFDYQVVHALPLVAGRPARLIPVGARRCRLDLELLVQREATETVAVLTYSRRAHRDRDVVALLERYEAIVRAVTADPTVGLSALRAVVGDRTVTTAAHDTVPGVERAPAGPLDRHTELLTEVWRHVLRDSSLGPETNFFRNGGNSFKALLLIKEIEDRLGVSVPLDLVFESATPRSMAAAIETL
ncbi:condensation domain-containing protein [Micromonospora peucetia]|nr:condensation domain-containing protein [Micromonospora peucetia]WSA34329.1 condensation domain-containing protein [Micromonospora peucetia]